MNWHLSRKLSVKLLLQIPWIPKSIVQPGYSQVAKLEIETPSTAAHLKRVLEKREKILPCIYIFLRWIFIRLVLTDFSHSRGHFDSDFPESS